MDRDELIGQPPFFFEPASESLQLYKSRVKRHSTVERIIFFQHIFCLFFYRCMSFTLTAFVAMHSSFKQSVLRTIESNKRNVMQKDE